MNKLIKNWSYLLVSDVSQSIISFFVFMFLARKLSPEGYGILNTIIAAASLFSVFASNFSSNQVVTREVTINPLSTGEIFRIVFRIRIISLILTVAALVIYQYHTSEGEIGFIISSSIIVISTLVWDLSESIAFGHFITKFTTIISIIASLCWLLVVLILPSENLNIQLVVIVYALMLFLRSLTYLGFSFTKFVKPNKEKAQVTWKAILLMSFPFLWMRLVGTFGDQIPILLLKGNSGASEVGYYSVGSKFVLPITLAVSTGLRAVFPFMTKLFQEDKTKFNKTLQQGFTIILIIGASLAMLLTVSSTIWLPFFFGKEYQSAILSFNYQAWLGVLISFDLLLSNVLTSSYRQNALAIITTIDVLIIFPLMFFGSKYGADGMAMSKLIGSLITVLYHIIVIILILKIDLKSMSFIFSLIYFVILMLVSIFIHDILLKLSVIVLLILIYSVFNKSPLRQIIRMALSRIKTTA